MPKRSKFDRAKETYWRGQILAQTESGLTVSAYCRREGISASSFYRWRRILVGLDGPVGCRQGESERGPEDVFVPVSVSGQADKPAVSSLFAFNAQAGIELVLRSGFLLRVGPGFDSDTLARLVDLLDSPVC